MCGWVDWIMLDSSWNGRPIKFAFFVVVIGFVFADVVDVVLDDFEHWVASVGDGDDDV